MFGIINGNLKVFELAIKSSYLGEVIINIFSILWFVATLIVAKGFKELQDGNYNSYGEMITIKSEKKNADDLDTWMSKNGDKICNLRCLPLEIDYSFKNFEQFFVMRLSMMKYILTNIFGVKHDQIAINDEVTINRIPKNQTHLKVGMHGKVIGLKDDIATINVLDKNNSIIENIEINIENLYIIENFQNI